MKSTEQRKGYDDASEKLVTQYVMGYQEYEILDASSGDATPSTIENCRAIKVDGAGIIRIDYIKKDGETVTEIMQINAGQPPMPVRNVTKLHRYYTGTTAGTATCYSGTDGTTITNAIKLLR
jgi:hypothetical protein